MYEYLQQSTRHVRDGNFVNVSSEYPRSASVCLYERASVVVRTRVSKQKTTNFRKLPKLCMQMKLLSLFPQDKITLRRRLAELFCRKHIRV